MINKKRKYIIWCCYFLVFVLVLGIRIVKYEKKESLFLDEYCSFILSSCIQDKGLPGAYILDDTTRFTGQQLQNILFAKDYDLFSTAKDIMSLRANTRDRAHPGLYYVLLRASLLGTDGQDIDQLKFRGFILNLFLFVLSFIFLWQLLRWLFKNDILTLCTLLIVYINPVSIVNTLYLREYQLQETFFIFFSYWCAVYSLKIIKNERIDTWKDMLILAAGTSLVLSTGYMAIFYVFVSVCFLGILSIKYKQKKNISFLICTMVLAYIFAMVIYVDYTGGLINGRNVGFLAKIRLLGSIEYLKEIFGDLYKMFTVYWGILIVGVITALSIWQVRRTIKKDSLTGFLENKSSMSVLLSLLALVWVGIVLFMVPYKHIRYIMAALPIMSLSIPFILSYLKPKKQLISSLLIIALFSYGVATIGNNVYLDLTPVDKKYTENQKIPLVIACDSIGWEQLYFIPYYTKDRTVEFSFSPDDFHSKINQYGNVYVIIQAKASDIHLYMPDDFSIESEFETPEAPSVEMKGYELKKHRH